METPFQVALPLAANAEFVSADALPDVQETDANVMRRLGRIDHVLDKDFRRRDGAGRCALRMGGF